MELQSRWKSPVFWSGVAAQILSILVFSGVIDVTKSDAINNVIAAICQLWVLVSQANNPTDSEGW